MKIRLAAAHDAEEFFGHTLRHFRESNQEGDPIFHPVTDFENWSKADYIEKLKESWAKSLEELNWERALVLEQDGTFLGHTTLQGGRMPGTGHRATFSIGLERGARGQGFGRALTQATLDWAREQGTLAWIELYVFTHNAPALALYRAMGFREVGTTEDLFRVHGQSVSDTHMVLRL